MEKRIKKKGVRQGLKTRGKKRKKRWLAAILAAVLLIPKGVRGERVDLGGFGVEIGTGTPAPRPTFVPVVPKPTREPATPYPTQRPATPYPTQRPAKPYPTQRPAKPYPTQRPATPYPTQRPATPYPTREPAAPYPTGEPEASQPVRFPDPPSVSAPVREPEALHPTETPRPRPSPAAAEPAALAGTPPLPPPDEPSASPAGLKEEEPQSLFSHPKGGQPSGYLPKIRVHKREFLDVLSFQVNGEEVGWRWEKNCLVAFQTALSPGEYRIEILLLGDGGALYAMPPWKLQIAGTKGRAE